MLMGAVVLVTVTGAVILGSSADQASPAAEESQVNSVAVERGDLSSMVSLNGTLTYRAKSDGSPYLAINQAKGIYTNLPEEGDKVGCGDVFYRVDDHPVLLLCGAVPAYRDLAIGDKGRDVRQLNSNLHEIDGEIDPDEDDFTWKTAQALKKVQDDSGVETTGSLDLDDAVFLPGSTRISKVAGKLGAAAQPGAPVAQATSDTLEVQVSLEASQQGEVRKGDRARITLPGNKSVKGRVVRLGRVAQTGDKDDNVGGATIPAFISLDKPRQARGLDRAPVQVEIETEGVKNALSVPVTAIVGKSGSGFAVDVVRGGGRRELVAVRLGLFDTTAGRVEVDGELREGDRVVVPPS
jgi:hypothetical protein